MDTNIFNVEAICINNNNRYEISINDKYKGQIYIFKFLEFEKFTNIALKNCHSINYYAIGWSINSDYECIIDSKTFNVNPDSLYLGYPGQRFKFESKGISQDAFFVCFDACILKRMNCFVPDESFIKMVSLYSVKIDDPNTRMELSSLFLKMRKEQEHHLYDKAHTAYMCALLEQVLLILLRRIEYIEIPDTPENKISLLYIKFMMKVNQYFNTQHKVGFYTNLLNITPKVLRNCTMKIVGKNPKDIINERIAEEIPIILRTSKKKCSKITKTSIGAELGFEELSHFLNYCKNMDLNINAVDA